MKPTDVIKDEHRMIGKALSSFRDAAAALERQEQIPADLLKDELDFITSFAFECHHRKEEEVLFPAIKAQLVAKGEGLISMFLAEHQRTRALVDTLIGQIDRYRQQDGEAAKEIARVAREYFALTISHMRKENTLLVELIEHEVPADKKLEIAERFMVIEDQLGPDHHRGYEALANDLSKRGKKLAA